ncbi:type II toxin-antitoxin system prevent-host-death family antitoxin [Pseudomonas sp. PB120]|uniref:type II toxin-antitoxin system prevent-host-death family antitoxin n=1 Tax=Pseudomonas sp. PB120 TaxID=2494700 RepID=UPI0012FE5450|nr:type II toxin-antitoxin system prevent-host-death family antitoxin [Pseudomonas sp. PB120]MVV50032.1 type II toxin-antitoxin system prevent-host-death family antitoxin [Pseudomonas sp. PB120]
MKRDIFSELKGGLEALAEERQGTVTLRTHKVELPKLEPETVERLAVLELNPAIAEEQLNHQRLGTMKAKLVLPEDFDAPLPDDMLDDFEGAQK